MKLKTKVIVRKVSAAKLASLDAAARAKDEAFFVANPRAPMPMFINGRAPGIRVIWPKSR